MGDSFSSEIRILHVDDESNFTEMSAEFLQRENDRFDIETATSVSEGLDRLVDGEFDCVVSDYDMAGKSGLEFLKTVRDDYPDLPFILFTGKGSEEVASDAISAGVTDYLQKESGSDQYTVLANRIANAVGHGRSRQRVERSEQRLRDVVDSLPHLLYVVDADGTYLLANQALAEFHGTTVADLEGSNVADILPDAKVETFREHVAAVLNEGEMKQLSDVEIPDSSGEIHLFSPRLVPYDFEKADGYAVLGTAVDVTNQRERERELEEVTAIQSTLLDTLPVGILAEDASRNVVAANNHLFDLLDLSGTPEELIGTDCSVLATEASEIFAEPETFVERIEQVLTEGTPVLNEEITLRDGRTLARSYQPIELPDGKGNLWVYRDITDGKRRETRLKALNATTHELMTAKTREDVAEIGVSAADEVLGMEANSIHLYDDERSALVPRAFSDALYNLIGGPPTFREGDSIAWRVYEDGEPLAVDDVHNDSDIHNPNSPVQSELYLPIADEGILIAGSDTPAAFDQQDIMFGEILAGNIAATLEQVKRTEELRAREQELMRQNDRLEAFASIVSHDLRNPLNVAEGRLELAREERDSDNLVIIDRALNRISALIDDLLTLAREGEDVQELEPVDIDNLVHDCWGNVDTRDATLDVATNTTIQADQSRLKQLFENLFRNAIEHGGTDVTVTVGGIPGGFYVEDDGAGISLADRETVFEPGYSTTQEGTGFGLSIVKQIVEAHGWEIELTDSEAGGARFEISGCTTE
ncbi:MAG: PAS domain-containing protein [Halobacteriales archaeon]|nr:PAS domain-containing protein [Halobacteriales archaeon]